MIQLRCVFLVLLAFTLTAAAGEHDLKPLFNGSDFSGWVEPENNIWWTIENGVLVGKNDPELKGSTLWTSKEYKDFVLQLDFRFGSGLVDSGVFLRKVEEQIQIGISGSLKRDMTCSPYVAGKGYPVEGVGVVALLNQENWNTMRIQAVGNVYTVTLNGKQVLEYPSLTSAEKGPLGLQVHPNRDMQIEFKNILIAEVNPNANITLPSAF
jgi:hypothetical protein